VGPGDKGVVEVVLFRGGDERSPRLSLQWWYAPLLDRLGSLGEPGDEGLNVEFGHSSSILAGTQG
jgi:hypothetical protein